MNGGKLMGIYCTFPAKGLDEHTLFRHVPARITLDINSNNSTEAAFSPCLMM